jgi:hypothetical protein
MSGDLIPLICIYVKFFNQACVVDFSYDNENQWFVSHV